MHAHTDVNKENQWPSTPVKIETLTPVVNYAFYVKMILYVPYRITRAPVQNVPESDDVTYICNFCFNFVIKIDVILKGFIKSET